MATFAFFLPSSDRISVVIRCERGINNQLKRTFKYSGAVNWNDLNPVIRNATSLIISKSAYLKSHFSHLHS